MYYKNIGNDYIVDNREYFRIDDKVSLNIHKVDTSTDIEEYYSEKLLHKSIDNEIKLENEQFMPIAKMIQNKYPEIYAYISHLEKKVDILSKKFDSYDIANDDDIEKQQVNISASGMRFVSEKEYRINDYLDLAITLYPSKSKIYLIAKVVRINIMAINKVNIAVQFEVISEANKEALIKHIHSKQLEELHK